MKVNFNRPALTEALALLTSLVPSRTPKPILRCVLVTTREKDVKFSATDLEVGLNSIISEVQIEQQGKVVIEADKLASIVRESNDDIIVLESDDNACDITGTDSHFTIFVQEPEQYPVVPEYKGHADIEVTLDELQAGIEQCLFATAKESSRYAINGVLWEVKGKKLFLVATDGRRLVRCKVNLISSPKEGITQQNIIVPAKTMSLLGKVSSHNKEKVAVKFDDNKILFSCGNVVISSNLVEGNFPKYEDIIPSDFNIKLKLSTEAALSAVRRASLLTSEESKGIKISIGKNNLVFSARAPEAGSAEIKMPLESESEPLDIGFNPQFLIEALRVIKTSEFEMELGQPDRPGLIKSGANFLCVLMPINLG